MGDWLTPSREYIVTESDWFTCASPAAMLSFLRSRGASDRKLRLFAVACCRRALPHMDHDGSRALVELVEQHLEGRVPSAELENARQVHELWCFKAPPLWASLNRADLAALDTAQLTLQSLDYITQATAESIVEPLLGPVHAKCNTSREAIPLPFREGAPPPDLDAFMAYAHQYQASWEPVEQARAEGLAREQGEQANLLRDIFGNVFHPVPFAPEWRTSTVEALAQSIYAERAFDRLPLLMDALMDAGCADEEVLGHCRQTTGHHRGCWVVDLVLGKE